MPDLIATSALGGRAALTVSETTLAEGPMTRITSVALRAGQGGALAALLAGMPFPEPNRFSARGDVRMVWTGRNQAFVIGDPPDGLDRHAVTTDQSDGWAILLLGGRHAEAALARFIPLDLRADVFPVGHAARAPLNHMSAIVMRTGAQAFEILVFRSMARTAWHEIEEALGALAARAALG